MKNLILRSERSECLEGWAANRSLFQQPFSDQLTLAADNRAMGAIGAAIALAQYAAILTAIGALARLSLLLTLRAVQLWHDGAAGSDHSVR